MTKSTIAPILKGKSELTSNNARSGPIVLSTRIRLARNLKDYLFPGKAEDKDKQAVMEACQEAVLGSTVLAKGQVLNVSELKDLEKQVLVERHLISRELAAATQSTAAIVGKNQSLSVMINEEDHMRIQIMRNGFHFKNAWKVIDTLDTEIEKQLNYAFSTQLGYLTACPTNLGTGMRASVMMHLPALIISEQMEKVVRAVNQLGLAVRGLFGEGSDTSGSIFQISNQQTLGESEEGIMKRLTGVLQTLIEQEQNARARLLETDRLKLFDKIGRAFGLLKNAYILTSLEAMSLLSLMRLAVDMSILPETSRGAIDRLLIESQPGHIQFSSSEDMDESQRDVVRANILREAFEDIDTLDFDKLT